jgi:hypothetical protein
MRIARAQLVDTSLTRWYHCTTRRVSLRPALSGSCHAVRVLEPLQPEGEPLVRRHRRTHREE